MAAGRLPPWVWLLPLGTAAAGILAWTLWCETETATWLGGVFVVATGLLVLAFVHEQAIPRPGFRGFLRRWLVAVVAGLAAAAATFVAAGLGYYLRCRPF